MSRWVGLARWPTSLPGPLYAVEHWTEPGVPKARSEPTALPVPAAPGRIPWRCSSARYLNSWRLRETRRGSVFERALELARRCRDFCADRGLDSGALKAKLW